MTKGAPVLDEGKLNVCRLLRKKTRLRFYRVNSSQVHLDTVERTISSGAIGIYIHIPFCKSICTFCPYFRDVLRDTRELEKYFNALLKEVDIYGRRLEEKSLRVVEIHVGGGTPSLVPLSLYSNLLNRLSQFFEVKCGIGIEVNPEDFRHYEYVEKLYSAGIDEVSIGIQSFDHKVLKSLGRKHSPEDNFKAVENSLKAGFKWVNVDLMFLAPNIKEYVEITLEEKLKAFRKDLEKCCELGVHQVTYYPTLVPRNSPGYRLVKLGKAHQELDSIDAFIDEAVDFAEDKGLHLARVYSISKKRYEYATVNLEMTGPLMGLGASAWSNTGLYQYVNLHDIHEYMSSIERSISPVMYSRNLTLSSRVWRLFFDQLSTGRVSWEAFKSAGIKSAPLSIKLFLKMLELNGIVKKDGSIYKLTRRGIREVYKSIINYVIEIPVKATEVFTHISKSKNYPEVVEIT